MAGAPKIATVTVLDEDVKADKEKERCDNMAYWNKKIEDIQNSDEVLEVGPECIHLY
jgi:hypothetical protein